MASEGQGEQAVAPAAEKVPGGQRTGKVEFKGQADPAGHSDEEKFALTGQTNPGEQIGVPVEQLKFAGQSAQESVRMRWLWYKPSPRSLMKTAPLASTVMPDGTEKRDPRPSENPAPSRPPSVLTTPNGETLFTREVGPSAMSRLPLEDKAAPKVR